MYVTHSCAHNTHSCACSTHTHKHTHLRIKLLPSGESYANVSSFRYSGTQCVHPALWAFPDYTGWSTPVPRLGDTCLLSGRSRWHRLRVGGDSGWLSCWFLSCRARSGPQGCSLPVVPSMTGKRPWSLPGVSQEALLGGALANDKLERTGFYRPARGLRRGNCLIPLPAGGRSRPVPRGSSPRSRRHHECL